MHARTLLIASATIASASCIVLYVREQLNPQVEHSTFAAPLQPNRDLPSSRIVAGIDDAPTLTTIGGSIPDSDLESTPRLSEPALDPSEWVDNPEMRVFEEQFAYEPIDPAWAGPAESRVATAISASGLSLVRIDFQCRSTLCRVNLVHTAPAVTSEDMDALRPKLTRLFRVPVTGLNGDETPKEIIAVKARGLVDAQGREYGNIAYFFREAPPAPARLASQITEQTRRAQELPMEGNELQSTVNVDLQSIRTAIVTRGEPP